MTRNKKFLVTGLALATMTAGGVAASAHWGGGWGHGRHHGGMMGHGLMGAMCSGNAAEMTDHLLVGLEYKIKPTDAQKSVFEDFKSAARAAAAKAKTACPPEHVKAAEGSAPAPHKSPVERLAMMETRLAAELEAVRTVRPAAEKLYAALSEDQKKAMAPQDQNQDHDRGGWSRRGEGGRDGENSGDMGREHRHHDWHHDDQGDGAPKAPDKP